MAKEGARLGADGELAVTTDNEMHDPVFPNGCAVCEVEVDPETGQVEIARYSVVDDVGRCINPMIVHGQTHGGVAQGVGEAMWEECVIDPASGQPLSGSFMDYGMPRSDNLPSFKTRIVEVLSPTNPFGIKAGGEGGCTPALAVVISAILDALAPLGVRDLTMPATPFKVWTAIQQAQRASLSQSGQNQERRQPLTWSRSKAIRLKLPRCVDPGAARPYVPARMTPLSHIRNFAIIAHIDHGKSTLADRLIQACGGLEAREMREQVLDQMELERERGITIKAQTVRLNYRAQDGESYVLNLMDTPGHVDFSYEVSRSLAACEGSLLVVDASQGVEAQTLANVYQAIDAGHEIVPVLNKIDLPAAEPDRVKEQIEDVIGLIAADAVLISAKTGLNIDQVLEALVTRLPSPKGEAGAPLKALLVDSWYDSYLGVVILVRVKDGELRAGQKIRLMATGAVHSVERVGVFTPKGVAVDTLGPGEIGFITAGIKTVADCRVGDTITEDRRPAAEPLPGFKPVQPVVFCGLFPTDAADYERLRDSLAKLRLNDASFEYEPETSAALGFGFRCGFLGLLHLEIIQERLAREFDLDLIATAPSVVYRVHLTNGAVRTLHNPADMPDPVRIDHIEEPWIKATILVPDAYLGPICHCARSAEANSSI